MAIKNRGFAKMQRDDPERQKLVASEGGRRAHQKGTAHEFTSEEAKRAGRKGGQATSKLRGEEFYHRIGRKGGQSKGRKNQDRMSTVNVSQWWEE